MKFYERGQALLIVILVMTIALTVGLSAATRTISNIRTTVEEENSQRAFSAAEAGIEQSMQNGTNSTGSFSNNNTTFQATIVTVAGQEFLLNNGAVVLKDDAVDLWLSVYPGYTSQWTGDVTIYWGTSSDVCNTSESINSRAALEIVVIQGTKINPLLTHYAVDPCAARSTANNFEAISAGGTTIEGKPLAFKKTIAVNAGMLMRIIPLYAPTVVGVRGCNAANGNCRSLPVQGRLITSVGISDTTQRKLVGFQEYPKLPVQIFPYLIFSPK